MLINVLYILTVRNNESLEITLVHLKTSVSTSFNDSLFFKNFMPEFFDFKEPFVQKNFIMHCKNIIVKIYGEETTSNSFKEYQLNKIKWDFLINYSIGNIEYIKSNFCINYQLIDYLQRIE
ncbi:hypothetical protein NUSPORA_02817 [Nucleospora cyclopteri]